jgi:hypothetical protein
MALASSRVFDRASSLVRLVIAVAWFASAGSAGLAGLALAQAPDAPRAHLSVQGPACASEAALEAAVHRRSARIAFVPEEPGVLLLEAALAERAPAQWQAELLVRGPRRSERQLIAASCEEAVDALGLLIAMTLDPALADARASEVPVRPPRNVKAAPTSEAPAAPAEEPTVEQPAPAPSATVQPEPAAAPAPEPTREPEQPQAPSVSQLGAGLAAQLTFGPTPEAMAGIALDLYWALERDSIWSPAVRLRASHGFGVSVSEPLGQADFALDLAALDLCPLRLPVATAALRGCASGSFGRLGARGYDTYDADSSARFFGSLGAGLWFLLPIAGSLQLQASASLGWALIRDAYEFTPVPFHRVSALHVDLGLGLGVRFL